MNEEEKNVYKCLFEYPTKKIASLEIENLKLGKELDQYKNNWEELKGWIKSNDEHFAEAIPFRETLRKMKELEENK